jgi:hypothetical protein
MHALEGSEYALKSAISAATLGNAALLFSYLSAFAAAITKTVTKGRPEKNRTTSMARFVIARPQSPYDPNLCQSPNWAETWRTAVPNGDAA